MNSTDSGNLVCLAADICVFTRIDDRLNILLIRRDREPFSGCWALPGGRLESNETLDQCALRELLEETGLRPDKIRHFANFSDPDRDPRQQTVSAAYIAWIDDNMETYAGSDAAAAEWFPVTSPPQLAFDHDSILKTAILELQKSPFE